MSVITVQYLPSQLVHAWKQWFQILVDAANGREISRRVTPEQYKQWHNKLMALCNKHGVNPRTQSAVTARKMGEIAEKWDRLEKILEADRDTLLQSVCIATEALHKRVKRRLFRVTFGGLLKTIILLGIIVFIAILFYDSSIITSIPRQMRGTFRSLERFAYRERGAFYGLTILLVSLGGVIMYSTKKS